VNEEMRERAKEFADKISTSKKKEITLISHIDADGITSMSIMVRVLKRAKIRFKGIFLRQLDERTVEKIPGDSSLKLFLDLGSGQQDILEMRGFKREEVLIIDHHIPEGNIYEQFNPLLLQREEKKVSAAGLAYLVAKNIGENSDLSKLAIVGAVGDMMANETNRLEGSMREIVSDARRKGFLKVTKDISAYGISTRPIHLMLSYTDDPYMDGLTDNKDNCLDLLKDLGIAAKEDERWRVWEDLSREEKRRIYSELIEKVKEEDQYRLSGENYIFKDERRRTPLRNAKEYSTLLNACGRWVNRRSVWTSVWGTGMRDMVRHRSYLETIRG
jgi:Single-stranded DNA-specific exonuclease